MRVCGTWAAAVAVAAIGALVDAEDASARVEAGMLTCEVGKGVALIVSSPRDLHCVFHKANGQNEAYGGKLREFGLDVGVSGRGVIAWEVIAATTNLPPGELGGRYVGAEAGVAVVLGGRGRVLVGGRNRTISLQPLSVEAQSGLNIAVGVASIELYPLFRASRVTAVRAPAVGLSYDAVPHAALEPHYGCGSYTHLQRGQTLYGLAHTCGVTVEALLDANPQITNVRDIDAGALIHLPTHVGHHDASPCGDRAVLAEGESLDHLAWRCGVTLHALLLENPEVRDLAMLEPGLVLMIPARGAPATEPPVQYAMTETDLPSAAPVATDARTTPVVPPPTAAVPAPMTDRVRARLEIICVNEATNRYGMSPGDVVAMRSAPTSAQTTTVSLDADGRESVCLIDVDGRVLYVSEIAAAATTAPAPVTAPPAAPTRVAATPAAADPVSDIAARLTPDETLVVTRVSPGQPTVESGRIVGYKAEVYLVHVGAGETLTIDFATPSTSAYFNVVRAEDPNGEALFAGMTADSSTATLTFPEEGDYLIRPFLVRAVARRGESADYTITITSAAPAPAAAAPPASRAPAADPSLPPNPYDATGNLRCSAAAPTFDAECPFGVVRGDGDTAVITVRTPAGTIRTLAFAENDDVTTAEGGRLDWGKQDDEWSIGIDGNEYYRVPEVVVVGD